MSIDWEDFENRMMGMSPDDTDTEHPFGEEIELFQEFSDMLNNIQELLREADEQLTDTGVLAQRFEIYLGHIYGALVRLNMLDSETWRHMWFLPTGIRSCFNLSGHVPPDVMKPFQAMIEAYLEIFSLGRTS